MQFINSIHEGDRVSAVFLCKSKQSLKTKAGKTYYSLQLQDKTGIADGKVWDLGPGIEDFDSMDFIQIEAQATMYQRALQLNIRRIRRADDSEYNMADYILSTRFNVGDMYKEILQYADSVEEKHLHALLQHFFVEDKTFINAFKTHSAAKTIHHGFAGGLLEHTLSVTRLCDFYAKHYDMLSRDLLITAALCHDIGKTKELSRFPANDYTDEGQLLGHIVIGARMVDDECGRIEGFPETLRNELVHCILAHHGELEYGSPKKPALAEALALNLADNADARLETMREFLSGGKNTEWLGYSRIFESNIRRTEVPGDRHE